MRFIRYTINLIIALLFTIGAYIYVQAQELVSPGLMLAGVGCAILGAVLLCLVNRDNR